MLYLDKEGRWYHEGVEITHERTCSLFYQRLARESNGQYYIKIGEEYADVSIEDAPYVVRSLQPVRVPGGGISDYQVLLSDGSHEVLDPETLFVGDANVLYCMVKAGKHLARFSRSAYQVLCSGLGYDDAKDRYWIPWRERPVYISQKDAHRPADHPGPKQQGPG